MGKSNFSPDWSLFFFFLSTIFLFIFFHTQHNIASRTQQNKTKQQTYTQHFKVQSKGRERGKDNQNTKSHSFIQSRTSTKKKAKHQWSNAWPHRLTPLYIHTSLFAGGYGSNMFFYTCFKFQVSSFKFYLSHTRLYRDCITSSEMRVGSAPWTVQILKKQHKGSKHKIRWMKNKI